MHGFTAVGIEASEGEAKKHRISYNDLNGECFAPLLCRSAKKSSPSPVHASLWFRHFWLQGCDTVESQVAEGFILSVTRGMIRPQCLQPAAPRSPLRTAVTAQKST